MRSVDLDYLPSDGPIGLQDLVASAERELRRRRNDYPKKVATRRLSIVRARREIEMQRRIVEALKEDNGHADNPTLGL